MRKTKIICTIGPATESYPMIEGLYEAGMNVVRLNMSHASRESAARVISWVKTLNRKVKYPVPILLDTQGPEIRTGDLPTALNLATARMNQTLGMLLPSAALTPLAPPSLGALPTSRSVIIR